MRLRFLILLGMMIGYVALAKAWNPPDGSTAFTGDSRTVAISTTFASPTQLLTRDSFIQRTFIMHTSTCPIFISSFSTTILVTFPSIPAASTTTVPTVWSPDGVNSPYWGAMYGVSGCATPPTVSIFRSK